MTETFYLGSTGFAQVGADHYQAKQQIEKDVLMAALNKKFGTRINKSGGRLVWAKHPHDFGYYHDMEFHIPEELIKDSTYDLVNAIEAFDWDTPELIAEMEAKWEQITPIGKQEKINQLDEIGDMARKLEEHGAIVMLPDNTEEELAKVGEMKKEVETMSTYKHIDIMELTLDQLDDSIVPACCVYGCEVEPDGHCEHGNPSVLLDAGMI